MKHNGLYLTLIGALILVVIFLLDSQPTLLIPAGDDEEPQLRPYALLEDAHTRHYDEQGLLSYEFVAASLEYFRLDMGRASPDDFTAMDRPQLTLHTEDTPWFVTADLGRVTDQGGALTLWPNVRIWQNGDGDPAVELITSHLQIHPQDKRIHTHAPVRITSPQGQLDAVGMEVDLQTRRIRLLDQVRGHHEPITSTSR